MKQASTETQVIVSTQSSLLLDHFEPEEVLVADRIDGATQLTRLRPRLSWSHGWRTIAWVSSGRRTCWAGGPCRSSGVSRILVHVEGQTEESFVNTVLAPHLFSFGYTSVSARLLGNARQRSRRGGIRPWDSVRRDILNHLSADQATLATTMVDYYGLPDTWPGRKEGGQKDTLQARAASVEQAVLDDISESLERLLRPPALRPVRGDARVRGAALQRPGPLRPGYGNARSIFRAAGNPRRFRHPGRDQRHAGNSPFRGGCVDLYEGLSKSP